MDDTATQIIEAERHIMDCEERIAPLLTLLANLSVQSAPGTRTAVIAQIKILMDELEKTRERLGMLREQAGSAT